jgi:hypothetical protein
MVGVCLVCDDIFIIASEIPATYAAVAGVCRNALDSKAIIMGEINRYWIVQLRYRICKCKSILQLGPNYSVLISEMRFNCLFAGADSHAAIKTNQKLQWFI